MVKPQANPLQGHLTKVLFTEEQIQKRVSELGAEITQDYHDKQLVMVGILRGALIFLSDLSRSIALPHSWDMCGAASYGSSVISSGRVQITKDIEVDVRDKDVIVVEDIYDSGRTLRAICDLLRVHQPSTIEVCTLLYKHKARRTNEVSVKYRGFEMNDEFVVGYGLDYNEYYRNLGCIGVLDPKIYT
jgi:hypoxanthine phosphoribosyltransferase